VLHSRLLALIEASSVAAVANNLAALAASSGKRFGWIMQCFSGHWINTAAGSRTAHHPCPSPQMSATFSARAVITTSMAARVFVIGRFRSL
jgi:hypothetical protein